MVMLVSMECSPYPSDCTHPVSPLPTRKEMFRCMTFEPLCKGACNYTMFSAHKYVTNISFLYHVVVRVGSCTPPNLIMRDVVSIKYHIVVV